MSERHVIVSGVAPDFAPTVLGQHYIDTTAKLCYMSVGIGGASDWFLIGSTANPGSGADSELGNKITQAMDEVIASLNTVAFSWEGTVTVGLADPSYGFITAPFNGDSVDTGSLTTQTPFANGNTLIGLSWSVARDSSKVLSLMILSGTENRAECEQGVSSRGVDYKTLASESVTVPYESGFAFMISYLLPADYELPTIGSNETVGIY